jgi:hypothetical protein
MVKGKGGQPDQHYVMHYTCTTLSLSTICNDQKIFQAIQENNVYFWRHYFQEDMNGIQLIWGLCSF